MAEARGVVGEDVSVEGERVWTKEEAVERVRQAIKERGELGKVGKREKETHRL